MPATKKRGYNVYQLIAMCENASSIEEIKAIRATLPKLTPKEKAKARSCMNDGIYGKNGTLISEKHPDD